jgi:hypothetical protein
MIEYVYLPARVRREEFYEEWLYYIANSDKCIRVDRIIIFFNSDINHIFLFTNCEKDLDVEDYRLGAMNLVHDVVDNNGDSIDFKFEYILILDTLNDEQKNEFISNKIVELKNKFLSGLQE